MHTLANVDARIPRFTCGLCDLHHCPTNRRLETAPPLLASSLNGQEAQEYESQIISHPSFLYILRSHFRHLYLCASQPSQPSSVHSTPSQTQQPDSKHPNSHSPHSTRHFSSGLCHPSHSSDHSSAQPQPPQRCPTPTRAPTTNGRRSSTRSSSASYAKRAPKHPSPVNTTSTTPRKASTHV